MYDKKDKGFTLVEMLVSLVLVLLAALTVARMLSASVNSYRHSKASFVMMQALESFKNRLLAFPFDSKQWQEGNYNEAGNLFKKEWVVKKISPSLKVIYLRFQDNRTQKKLKTWFYKSRTINNYSR